RDEVLETREMLAVEGRDAPYGQTHSVDRQRVVSSNMLEQVMRGTAVTHIVFGVNFEKIDATGARQNILSLVGLEAHPGPRDGDAENVSLRRRSDCHGRPQSFEQPDDDGGSRPPASAKQTSGRTLDRRQRTWSERGLRCNACTLIDEPPGIALI